MATDLTSNYSIPFPKPGDPVNVAGDMEDLATRIDDVLYSKTSNNFINTFSAPQIVEILTDPVGITPVPSAFRVTQSGTGAALLVTVDGNPGLSPFIIDNSGNVGVGKTSPSVKLDVVGDSTFTGTVTANLFSGSGASLTTLNGSNISSGTVADARIASSIARLSSPNFTGTPLAPTATVDTNTTQIATTAYVVGQGYAKLISPSLTTPSLGVATATSINGTTIPTSKTLLITDNIGSSVQAWDADLDSIAAIAGTSGFLKKTAANTWSLDNPVTSVAMTVPTGLSVTPSSVTTTGTFAISLATGYSIPTTASQATWDTAYADRNKWDGGSTGLVAATGRASLGATTVGNNIFTLTDPSAISYVRISATNTVTAASASTIKTDLSLNNVENTALSTWAGTTNITTLGTIGTGTWNASTISVGRGGTGATTFTANGVLLGNTTSAISATSAGTADQVLRVPAAGGAPAFGAIDISKSAAITGTLSVTNGGTGITSLGTGIATALGTNVGTAGSVVVNGGVLGTPSSGTLTNATGLPVSTGISGLGTGVATLLAAAPSGGTSLAGTSNTTFSGTTNIAVANITSYAKYAAAGLTAPITANTYTVLDTDTFIVFNMGGSASVTFPTASSYTGRMLYLKNLSTTKLPTSASTNIVPIAGGTATQTLFSSLAAGKFTILVSNGTAWEIMAQN